MRKIFLKSILITILASCVLTALGVGLYGIFELSRTAEKSRDKVFRDAEMRFGIYGKLLELSCTRMRSTAETALHSFDREYPTAQAVFSATSSELKALADALGVDDLYVLDDNFVVRASSLPEDLGLNLAPEETPKFSRFLESTLGAGRVLDHGLSLSIRTSRINGYYYYSPGNSNYILEASFGAGTILSCTFGTSFYDSLLVNLFEPIQMQTAEAYGVDFFLFDGREGVSFLGNPPDPFLTPEIVSRLMIEEKISDNRGWISTEYRSLSNGAVPLSFADSVFIRISFDRHKFYRFGLHALILTGAIAALITFVFFFIARSYYETVFLNRLEALSANINAVACGDYGVSFKDTRADELSSIGEDIEQMVSGIVRNEERLHNIQRSELIALFSSGLAHDFNNLLSTIAGAASLLENQATDHGPGFERDIQETAELIRSSASRAGAMTRDLLALSRGDTNRPFSAVDLGSLLSGVSRLFARSLDPAIRFVYGPFPSGMIINGDDSRLRQLFLNLLVNSTQALSDTTDPSPTRPKEIRIQARITDGSPRDGESSLTRYCETVVSDTGPGIPEETRDRIFSPFFTTKQRGTGVGLSMALSTARAHRGTIILSDAGPEGGAAFRVLLPLSEKPGAD